ncbi:hypothetical protein GCM10025786_28180 [Nocardioides caeni]
MKEMDQMDEEWQQALRGGELRATGDAVGLIAAEVRRRRHRRRAVATAGVAGVAATALVAAVLSSGPEQRRAADPVAAPDPGDVLFSCADSAVDDSSLNLPDDVREQWEADLEAIEEATFSGFAVKHATVTGLGVIVLVTGDVDAAREVLEGDYDAVVVHGWDASGPSVGLDEDGQTSVVGQWTLEPAKKAALRVTREVRGFAGLAYWDSAGAILLQWKEPVPAQVQALESLTFAEGGRIVVKGVPYSLKEAGAAMNRVQQAMQSGQIAGRWTMSSPCNDGTGIEIGIDPSSLGDRRAELQEELAQIAGMPVMVVPEEPAVALMMPGGG